jgi:large subunit ribosomal protein L13
MTREVRVVLYVHCIAVTRTPVDCGDYVIVTHARGVVVSGSKDEQKMYYKHTMYPGGLKQKNYELMMKTKPDEVRNHVVF